MYVYDTYMYDIYIIHVHIIPAALASAENVSVVYVGSLKETEFVPGRHSQKSVASCIYSAEG